MDSFYEKLSKERKTMQDNGDMPSFFTTGGWQLFKKRYLYQAKTPREQYERIAKTLAQYITVKPDWMTSSWEEAFMEIMWEGTFSPSTPLLSNTGTNRGFTVSCSGNVIPNNIQDIYERKMEVAALTKYGFGTASYLGDISPRGTVLPSGVECTGVVPVIEGFVHDMRYVAQGSNRRGAWAGYLPIDHGDFFELVDYLKQHPDDLNIGWCVTQAFIDRMNKGDKDAVERFQKAMATKLITGKGYFFFPDKANAKRPQMYVDKGLMVVAPQLCVAPETTVLTSQGHKRIDTLVGENVDVWNGSEWSNVQIVKTSDKAELITVELSCGRKLTCTKDHKFYKTVSGTKSLEIRAADLLVGDKLIKLSTPVIQGDLELDKAYQNGFYTGDGTLVKGKSRIYLYDEKKDLLPYFDVSGNVLTSVANRLTFTVDGLQEKYFVPSADYTVKSRVDWMSGLLDSDGCLTSNQGTQSFQVGSVYPEFLRNVQNMLQTLGVQSKVVFAVEAGLRKLPKNDGSGEDADFMCKRAERLLIAETGIQKLLSLGLSTKRLKPNVRKPNRDCLQFSKVVAVIDSGRTDATFCFTEPKKHLGVFNGILTGQCNEIMLHSSEEYTYTCVLGSMVATQYEKYKDKKHVFIATVLLDCVCSDFIAKAKGKKGMERAVRFTEASRALGLGCCGFHTALQQKMIPYEGFEAHMFNNEIFKHMHEESLEASKWMAEVMGEPEWCKGYGVRNTHRMACAPTKSTALIMGGLSEGINPDTAMTFTQLTPAGEVDRANPTLLALMKGRGVYDKKHFQQLTDGYGSVQHVDWLSDEEKLVFRTAFEINQEAVIRLASSRQRFIDQYQSVNLFFSADESESVIAKVHQQAFEDPNILGLYYCYSKAGVQGSSGECIACS